MFDVQLIQKATDRRSSALRIYCLGVFRVLRPGEHQAIGTISKHKMWLLFKYLVAHKGSAVQTEKIMELLWPGGHFNDTSCLRTTISRLKTLLEPQRIGYQRSSYIIYSKDNCAINVHTSYWVDVDEFETLCARAHQLGNSDRPKAIEHYLQALSLYQGDYFSEDLDLEWTLVPREYYRRLFIDATAEVALWMLESNEWAKAGILVKQAIKIDPYAEKLQILLMKALLGMGNLKAAAEHYSYYSSFLYKELGVKPSEEWKSLYKQLRDPGKDPVNKLILDGNMEISVKESGPMVCAADHFWDFLLYERRRLARNGGESSLVVMGLTQNHSEVDNQNQRIIAELESIIYQRLRKSDIICRLDRLHLALLLPATGVVWAQTVVKQIKEHNAQNLMFPTQNLEIKIKSVIPL